jgi:hypothetical protein
LYTTLYLVIVIFNTDLPKRRVKYVYR